MRWIAVALIAFGAWQTSNDRAIAHPPGEIVREAPLQRELAGTPPTFQKSGYTIKGLARFALTARVLGVERYRFDRGADLVPVDLALGWGPMSDSGVLGKLDISQGGRFYYWRTADFPVPRRDIETNSANMHLIAADADVERQLKRARVGSVVELSGYLVEASAPDGWRWSSSMTRDDTGAGACELVWVERITLR